MTRLNRRRQADGRQLVTRMTAIYLVYASYSDSDATRVAPWRTGLVGLSACLDFGHDEVAVLASEGND